MGGDVPAAVEFRFHERCSVEHFRVNRLQRRQSILQFIYSHHQLLNPRKKRKTHRGPSRILREPQPSCRD